MNAKSDSPKNNKAFKIRMSILLLVMLAVGGAFAYDRLVLVAAGKAAVDRIVAACDSNEDRTAVHKAAGCEPTTTEKIGPYQLDNWVFGRIASHLPGHKVSVVFRDEQVGEVYSGGITRVERASLTGE